MTTELEEAQAKAHRLAEEAEIDRMKPGDLILVKWEDSFASPGLWEDRDGLEPLPYARCETAGFLVDKGPFCITIVGTRSEDQVLGRLTIPLSAILEIHRLERGEKVKGQ